jgi:hypothetical protein
LTFTGLHSDISQKTQLFITTAVRISNPRPFLRVQYTHTVSEKAAWRKNSMPFIPSCLMMHTIASLVEKSYPTYSVCLISFFNFCWKQFTSDKYFVSYARSRNSSVSIATGYRLDGQSSILGRGKWFLLSPHVQTSSGAHPAFYAMGTKGSFPGYKVARV